MKFSQGKIVSIVFRASDYSSHVHDIQEKTTMSGGIAIFPDRLSVVPLIA